MKGKKLNKRELLLLGEILFLLSMVYHIVLVYYGYDGHDGGIIESIFTYGVEQCYLKHI